jgi:hypothetical protein
MFYLLSALAVLAVLAYARANRRSQRDGQWHPAYGRNQMYRWADERWEYRDMTSNEAIDSEDRRVW